MWKETLITCIGAAHHRHVWPNLRGQIESADEAEFSEKYTFIHILDTERSVKEDPFVM